MPGSKPGERRGGRQKGTQNKVNRELKAKIAASGSSMLEILVDIARYHHKQALTLRRSRTTDADKKAKNITELRVEHSLAQGAAEKAAPYLHPHLQSVLHGTDPDNPLKQNVVHTLDPASARLIGDLVK